MIENGLRSISAAAAELNVHRMTVSDLIVSLGITPKRMTNGKAKGLDNADMRALRKALGLKQRGVEPAIPA